MLLSMRFLLSEVFRVASKAFRPAGGTSKHFQAALGAGRRGSFGGFAGRRGSVEVRRGSVDLRRRSLAQPAQGGMMLPPGVKGMWLLEVKAGGGWWLKAGHRLRLVALGGGK